MYGSRLQEIVHSTIGMSEGRCPRFETTTKKIKIKLVPVQVQWWY